MKVDSNIASAVNNCYGEFLTLTEPILSQATITSLADECHALFSLQCTAISTLLNFHENSKLQKRSHLLPFYHRMVFYSFMSLARMRCNKNVGWWGVINACIRYGSYDSSSRSRDSVFFGHSVSQRALMEKTRVLGEPRLVLLKFKKALSSAKVHIGVFDNSQKGTDLKTQRFGISNMFCKVTTTRMFMAIESEREPATFPSNTISERVLLTYKQQAIPSPYGMPHFEEPSEQRTSFAIEAQSTDHYLPSTSVDFTGCRVSNYMALLEMADEFQSQKHYLSRPTNTEYAFQPPMYPNASISVVRATLSSNRSEGLYALADSFQYNIVLKWCSERKWAKVLCLPVSPDDETTKKGAGNVTLSMLELCGILKVDVSSTNNFTPRRHTQSLANLGWRWPVPSSSRKFQGLYGGSVTQLSRVLP
jgi:hypothetical protein